MSCFFVSAAVLALQLPQFQYRAEVKCNNMKINVILSCAKIINIPFRLTAAQTLLTLKQSLFFVLKFVFQSENISLQIN